ncbi:MAG: MFS transporter [Halobacteriaceae archaeon]
MTPQRRRLWALYLARFANSLGLAAILTLLGQLIGFYGAEGVMVGLFVTGLTATQAIAVVPLAWLGDRFDKRAVLLGGLGLGAAAYLVFGSVTTSGGFVVGRAVQGIAVTATGLMTLALVGELSAADDRANNIGRLNSVRFAGAIVGSAFGGVVFPLYGPEGVFVPLAVLMGLSLAATWRYTEPDTTTVEGFAFFDLALSDRILSITGFRAQYAVAVTLVRNWVPIFAGASAARGGLAYAGIALTLVVTAEKFTNMLCQPYTGRLSDRFGRAPFVLVGGACYGLVALAVPFAPAIGESLGLPESYGILGPLSAAFLPLVALNGLLGVADSLREPASMALFADEGSDGDGIASSFGVRSLVWRPGSVLAPMAGGYLMATYGTASVFYAGALAAFSGVLTMAAALLYVEGPSALRGYT